jgi:hypothetical protein
MSRASKATETADTPRLRAREKYQPVVVGRGRELAELWELALKGRHVVVAGPPGIGKTVLLEMLYRGLASRGDLPVFRIADSRQFKPALLELAERMRERGIFRHPTLPPEVVASLSWEKLAPKVRSLPIRELAEAVVASLTGRRAVLIWDHFEKATPTELAWLHQFLDRATVLTGVSDPSNPKLKPILDRIPARVELESLAPEECDELVDRCFEIAPFAVSNPEWYKREIRRKSGGNPRAIKDLLADHSLEKAVDGRFIRGMANEQGARYFPISWLVLVAVLLFSAHRYIGRGLGDRDAYIIGAVGMVTFLFLSFLVRRANRTG